MSQGKRLTANDCEPLRLLADGKCLKQIADELGCGYRAAVCRVSRLKKAMGATTVAHAVVLYDRSRRHA